MSKPYFIKFNKSIERSNFNCGNEVLNFYIKKQVSQDIRKRLTVCFCLMDNNHLVGYYTLSNYSIHSFRFTTDIKKKFPKSYNSIPCTLLGRLAIDNDYSGNGYGELALIHALKKSYDVSENAVASYAVVTHPIDKSAIKFYEKYGFIQLNNTKIMFLEMKLIKKLFN